MACVCSALSASDAVPLFDGKTLSGWEGDPEHWRVESGAIVGEIPNGERLGKNTWLVWRGGELADFDLRLQFKLSGAPAANSGVQFRCQVRDVDHVSGYQADLDTGATWLGRIYDEHGRALLVERGTRVRIAADGTRHAETLAPADQYAVLFRPAEWNDYRIVAVGDHIAVFINGTLFSELKDEETGERDLSGRLAFQLHSGPETRVEFRDIQLKNLEGGEAPLAPFSLKPEQRLTGEQAGVWPRAADGAALNMGFEEGSLAGWTATGDAFDGQPIDHDGIAARWQGQTSNKEGEYFVGGFEVVGDRGVGTLLSRSFRVTHPYATFLIGGGETASTRVEIIAPAKGDTAERVIFSATGQNREQMRRVIADLRQWQGRNIAVRLVDESRGGWGHLNFDDFRFHDEPPADVRSDSQWRSTKNPLLNHLVRNSVRGDAALRGSETAAQMFVPAGFSVDVIAAEPDLHQPMAFTFDARGRLWVVEGYSYPQKRAEGEGLDRILIFSDEDGDGTFEKRKIFAEGLNLVSGMEVGHGGVWVGAAPQLLFIPDADGDDRPDSEPQVLLDGFGYADTHETLNSFTWGPDGWLYGNQGVFNASRIGPPGAPASQRQSLKAGVWRYHPTGHVFEVFAHGGSNQWGLDFDEHGQLFMTHCRSRWGKGPTTHVVQGGHYWNQVNSGYAPFISAIPLPDRPAMRNYLLASARYGHGEGGAGRSGSREVYGGHSHVGTMIYLGDNWPQQYRNHLFTHNLHGHQLNHQVNRREAGGYNTVHAGYDVLFCADPQYIGVDLIYGPDGAVYMSDWYDPRHCHNPNVEHWDRGNGRVYRMKFDAAYEPVVVDYSAVSDSELVAAQLHPNDWHVRTARMVLAERAERGSVASDAVQQLVSMSLEHPEPARRLRAVWALHAVGGIDAALTERWLDDESEYVRGWAVQLAVESLEETAVESLLAPLVSRESSLFVRRYLASAIPRVPRRLAWHLAQTLAVQPENADDRQLPLLLWYGVAPLMEADLDRAMKLADATRVPVLRDFVEWYAAKISDQGRETVAERLVHAAPEEQHRLLSLFELGVRGMRGLQAPGSWSLVSARLYDSADEKTRRAAQSVGAAFGDQRLYDRMRAVIADADTSIEEKRHAISILTTDPSPVNLPYFLALLDSEPLHAQAIPLTGRFDDPAVAEALIGRLPQWNEDARAAALEVLASRPGSALRLLDAIQAAEVDKDVLTAYHARQMANLGNEQLDSRLAAQWGRLGQTSEELKEEIRTLVSAYQSAPLWAYSEQEGAKHFKTLCAACHQPDAQDENIAPKLAGSGSKGIEYVVENVIDPNAVIGADFQSRVILTVDGRIINGLVQSESDSAVTVRTANDTVTIAKEDIEQIQVSENSFMPVGLLDKLNDRERLELLKYLMQL